MHSRTWFELSDWELPHPMWHKKSLRTPDPLSICTYGTSADHVTFSQSGSNNKPSKNCFSAKRDHRYYRELSRWTDVCCPYKPFQKPSDYGFSKSAMNTLNQVMNTLNEWILFFSISFLWLVPRPCCMRTIVLCSQFCLGYSHSAYS